MKKRFEDAQVGDRVYSRNLGFGVIAGLDEGADYCIHAQFEDHNYLWHTIEGEESINSVEGILFYVDGDNKYCETRPTPKLDWFNVPKDTKVWIKIDLYHEWKPRYFSHFDGVEFWCFCDGATSWSTESTTDWAYCKLGETIVIDGVTFPEDTE